MVNLKRNTPEFVVGCALWDEQRDKWDETDHHRISNGMDNTLRGCPALRGEGYTVAAAVDKGGGGIKSPEVRLNRKAS